MYSKGKIDDGRIFGQYKGITSGRECDNFSGKENAFELRHQVMGGVGAVVSGAGVYMVVQLGIIDVGVAPVVVALAASAAAMILGGLFGPQESREMVGHIEALHG